MKRVLLDTNAYVGFLSGEERVLDVLAGADTVFMSAVVLGELFAGFRGGTKEKANRALLDRFLAKPTVAVLDVTQETAEIFGDLKSALKRSGTPLPINDVWIAAHAVETGSVLVTFDKHFQDIPAVRLW
jgi:tRNA(fMet)-specific endonuclease VapC